MSQPNPLYPLEFIGIVFYPPTNCQHHCLPTAQPSNFRVLHTQGCMYHIPMEICYKIPSMQTRFHVGGTSSLSVVWSSILELYITHPIPYTLLSIQENMRQGGISSTIECVPHYKGSSSSGYFTVLLVPVSVPAPASLIALHYAIIVAHPRHSPTIVL